MSGTSSQRAEAVVLTAAEILEAHWPEMQPRLQGILQRRGVPAHDAAEIVQETAFRALSRDMRFDSPDGMYRWACTVARNITIEGSRRRHRLADDEVPDVAASEDVAGLVEDRFVLEAVGTAMARLPAADQASLRAAATTTAAPDPADRKEATRLAVRRHRARQRLLAMCKGLFGALVFGWRRFARPGVRAVAIGVPVLCAVLVVLGLDSDRSRRPEGGRAMVADDGVSRTHSTIDRRGDRSGSAAPADRRTEAEMRTIALTSRSSPARTYVGPDLPVLEVRVPGVRRDGAVRSRPRTDHDHLVCTDTIVTGWQCADPPDPPDPPRSPAPAAPPVPPLP